MSRLIIAIVFAAGCCPSTKQEPDNRVERLCGGVRAQLKGAELGVDKLTATSATMLGDAIGYAETCGAHVTPDIIAASLTTDPRAIRAAIDQLLAGLEQWH